MNFKQDVMLYKITQHLHVCFLLWKGKLNVNEKNIPFYFNKVQNLHD